MDDIYQFLQQKLSGCTRLAVLGAGSVLKADDGAGMYAVEKLQEACPSAEYPNVRFYPGETAPENYSGSIKRFCPTHLLVIDAADVGRTPGSFVDIPPEDVGGPTFCSHMLPLRVMLDYLAAETGAQVTLLGIQHKSIIFDTDMTPEIRNAVDLLCEALEDIIKKGF